MKELHPQTDRERQLEQQLVGTVRRLHSLTVKSMNNQKKLEEECHQATEKLEQSQDQRLMKGQRTKEVLQNAEKAKQELLELGQLRETEQAIMDEYQKACERLLRREMARDRIESMEDRGRAMKSQETSSQEVEKLSVDSLGRISAYTAIKEDRTLLRYSHDEKQRKLDSEVRSARIRQDKLDDELNKSDKRRKTWERDSRQSVKEIETFDREGRQSGERHKQLQWHILQKKIKIKKATEEAYCANWAIENELDDQEHVFQQELDMSSERTQKHRQEISQVEKRQHWLDQMKSACDDDGSARELFEQTSSENDFLKKRLQHVLKSEENLSKRLQQSQENVKVSKRVLQIASESLKNLQEKADCDWKRAVQADDMALKEIEFLTLIGEALEGGKRVKEETDIALSKEMELHMKLRQVSDNEEIFKIPLRQLRYGESGNCSSFAIVWLMLFFCVLAVIYIGYFARYRPYTIRGADLRQTHNARVLVHEYDILRGRMQWPTVRS